MELRFLSYSWGSSGATAMNFNVDQHPNLLGRFLWTANPCMSFRNLKFHLKFETKYFYISTEKPPPALYVKVY